MRPLLLLLVLSIHAAGDPADQAKPIDSKVAARLEQIATLGAKPGGTAKLLEMLDDFELTVCQSAAVAALNEHPDPETGTGLLQRWRSIKPGARINAVQLLVARPEWRLALIEALEKGEVLPAELSLNQTQRALLLDDKNTDLARRAAKFFEHKEFAGRKKIIDSILSELPDEGNLPEGNELYRQRCLICHRHGRLGNAVGPDLSGEVKRTAEEFITHFVDPNLVINPSFVTCEVTRKNGAKAMGILAEESSESVTLVKGIGLREVIPWQEIASFKTTPKSLMQEGLESGLSPTDFRSLVEYLQSVDPPAE